jgi:putative ABC transport system permease protein
MRQILSESVLLSFLAGYGGFFVGVLVLSVLDKIPQPENESFFENPYISFTLAVTVLLILIITGLLAGIIPAKNALNSKAIDALRDE